MNSTIRNAVLLAAATLIWGCASPTRAQEAAETGKEIRLSGLVEETGGGFIDWGGRMVYATGDAVLADESREPNRARALLRARDYAKMLAIANLLMIIEDTTVSYDGVAKDLMDKDPSLRKTIEGYVKNVEILKSETFDTADGRTVKVTVGTRMYGEATPGGALLVKLAETEKPKQPPLLQIPLERSYPRPSRPRAEAALEEDRRLARRRGGPAASRPVDIDSMPRELRQEGPFTSLIVDARGFGVPQALSPKIRKHNGDEVYGTPRDRSDPAIRDGLVAYAATLEAARESDRCGRNPLLIQAIGRGGGRSMCDVMISDDDAKLVVTENAVSEFLKQHSVIFVVDPPGSALSESRREANL